ncbi:hypothetical protein HYS47_02795 [Candidatus Woesearchaeota archaeon]|nr:hypothetical protein [Candidatus Woesearchaeota archaeon]
MGHIKQPIILVSGGTGVGTSTISFEVAKLLGIPTIIGTDLVREIIRSILQPGVYSALEKSTYLAGQTANYSTKSSQVKKAEILRAYKTQCAAVSRGVEGVIQRAFEENTPIIVEGVHLLPGKLEESELYPNIRDRLEEYTIFIKNPNVHKDRFAHRQQQAPHRGSGKYLKHFREIRWIHDYIAERVRRFPHVIPIDNTSSLDHVVHNIMWHHYRR